jgi:hypothetical protein
MWLGQNASLRQSGEPATKSGSIHTFDVSLFTINLIAFYDCPMHLKGQNDASTIAVTTSSSPTTPQAAC